MKTLVLITTTFPYGNKEPFLNTEIQYVNGFERFVIFSSCAEGEIRNINLKGVNFHKFPISRLNYFFVPFHSELFKELMEMVRRHKFSWFNLKVLIKTTFLCVNTCRFASKVIDDKYNSFKGDNVTFYSYWLSYHAHAAILLSSKYNGNKCISRAHRFDVYEEREDRNYIPYRRLFLTNLSAVYPISEDALNILKGYGYQTNIVCSRLGTIDYGINPLMGNNSFVLVSCSWCVPVKRLHLIIEALSHIDDITITWIHFGDGVLMNELKDLAASKLPVNVNCEFKGACTNEEILTYYKSNHIDAFINVSSSEGIPVSIMEAISFGIPAIATNVGGTSEIVIDNESGFLIEKESKPEEIADLIRRIRSLSDKQIEDMRQRVRRFWNNNYCADNNYKSFFQQIQ